ncbi:serine protease inhibitor dipetalogastin-like [Cloeon dipterum]|uniref:serine protease inhibitor dipetalogastin-like n=1 Tax=Cloeon dipterum TaxID=197152 RepID=UPI00321FEEB4
MHQLVVTFSATALLFLVSFPMLTVGLKKDNNCPRICPPGSGDPVCGTDDTIYPSACEMQRKTCNKAVRVSRTSDQKCQRAQGSNCTHKCNKDSDPVCGSDGKTYHNKCFMMVATCKTGAELSHLGPCTNITPHRENCPVDCESAPIDGPICGSDGNVYNHTCSMKLLTCGQGVVRTDKQHCKTTRHCREACWRISKPVCASDSKVYPNVCKMKSKNCGKHVFEIPMKYCKSLTQERNALPTIDCPTTCDDEPVEKICGSDGNVYDNECDMKSNTCGLQTKRSVTKVDFEKCRKKFTNCNMLQCNNEEDFVCGSDAKTYRNPCHLQIATCLKGVQMAHLGNCTSLLHTDECPETCENEPTKVVCASDGNVYRSQCEMKMRTCGQRVVAVPEHHCKTTSHCNQTCGEERNFVCGSDNKFYRSECEMKKSNCGKHVFVVPMKRCLAGFQFMGCQKICPTLYEPVCGSDKKTYSNDCFLDIENCRSRSLVFKVHDGKCGEPEKSSVKNFLRSN